MFLLGKSLKKFDIIRWGIPSPNSPLWPCPLSTSADRHETNRDSSFYFLFQFMQNGLYFRGARLDS